MILDDFVGSGNQAIRYLAGISKDFSAPLTYISLAGMPNGIDAVRTAMANRIRCFDMLTLVDGNVRSAFEPGYIFSSSAAAELAKAVCEKYGRQLMEHAPEGERRCYPFGYGECSTLIAFAHNTPNNTLPIFWSQVMIPGIGTWPAPYPRGAKVRRKHVEFSLDLRLEFGMLEDLVLGALQIRKVPKYQAFDPPITRTEIKTALAPRRQLPQILQAHLASGLERRVEELRSKGKSVELIPGYSLRAVTIDKWHDHNSGVLKRSPSLTFEPATYADQIMFGERINEPGLVEHDGRRLTLREYMDHVHEVRFGQFDWSDVSRLPIPQRFANVVGLVVRRHASDPAAGKVLVCGIRGDAMAVGRDETSDAWPVTLSCAEGMRCPDDAEGYKDRAPNPFNTAERALHEELGVIKGIDYRRHELKMLALAYDSNRCQPVACYFLESETLDFDELLSRWQTKARDNNESRAIIPVPKDEAHIESLLKGKLEWNGRRLQMFSNHQQVGLLAVAFHLFGEEAVGRMMS